MFYGEIGENENFATFLIFTFFVGNGYFQERRREMEFARSAHNVPAVRKFVVIRTAFHLFSYTNFEPRQPLVAVATNH